MSIEKRIYEGDDWGDRVVIINHGGSESVVLSDTSWPKEHDSWGQPLKKKDKKFKWIKPDPYEHLEREILGI